MASPPCSQLKQLSIFGPQTHRESEQPCKNIDSEDSHSELAENFQEHNSAAQYPSKILENDNRQSQPPTCTLITKLDVHLRCRIWAFAVTEDEPITPYSRMSSYGRDAEIILRQNIERVGTESMSRIYLPKKLTVRDLTLTCKDIRSDILSDQSFYKHNHFHFANLSIAAYYLHTLSISQRRLLTSLSFMYTHGYHAEDVFEMILQCQNLRRLHLDVSPIYFAPVGKTHTIQIPWLSEEPRITFYEAENWSTRVVPPVLKTGLEDFASRAGFYQAVKGIQNMKNLRELKLIGRASDEMPAGAYSLEIGLGYDIHTGLLHPEKKRQIWLPLTYGQSSITSQSSEDAVSKKRDTQRLRIGN